MIFLICKNYLFQVSLGQVGFIYTKIIEHFSLPVPNIEQRSLRSIHGTKHQTSKAKTFYPLNDLSSSIYFLS